MTVDWLPLRRSDEPIQRCEAIADVVGESNRHLREGPADGPNWTWPSWPIFVFHADPTMLPPGWNSVRRTTTS